MICDYCQNEAVLVSGENIYPHRHDLFIKKFWECAPCKAYVGCHLETIVPLGRLANADLRKAKQSVHALLDPLWKAKKMRRTAAYAFLAEQLGLTAQTCHVGMFDLDTCAAAVKVLNKL